jgi:Outer membrane protein beta-barrel domain
MFNLHRKKITLSFVLLLGFILNVSAQQNRMNDIIFQQDYDVKTVHFGYYLGPHVARYNLKFNQQFEVANQQNPSYIITSPPVIGIWRFGGVVNFYINDMFDFQTCLGASIYDREVRNYKKGSTDVTKSVEGNTAWIDVPAHLKYKSERRRNTRMYMMAGFRYAAEIGQVSRGGRSSQAGQLVLPKKRNDFMIEYGVGLEKFTPFAKMTPELCFSHGLVNLLVVNNSAQQRGLIGMNSNTVTLFVYFE